MLTRSILKRRDDIARFVADKIDRQFIVAFTIIIVVTMMIFSVTFIVDVLVLKNIV